MPLENAFERAIRECEKEAREKGLKPLSISQEESNRIYNEINAEMKDVRKELRIKEFKSELEAKNFLIY